MHDYTALFPPGWSYHFLRHGNSHVENCPPFFLDTWTDISEFVIHISLWASSSAKSGLSSEQRFPKRAFTSHPFSEHSPIQ